MMSRHDHFPRHDALRRDRLRAAAADLDARWQHEDRLPAGLATAIDGQAGAAPETVIEALMPWLADLDWLRGRIAAATALLAEDPFVRPPLRLVGGGEGAGGLILAERGAIRLSLQLHRAEAMAPPATALFIPGCTAIRAIAAGGARFHRHHAALTAEDAAGGFVASAAAPCRSDPPRPLRDGEILILDTAREAFTLSEAAGDVLLVELAVQPPLPLPIRSHDIATGRLIHVSASRRDSSFRQMALALLRTMRRRDAASLFAAATTSEDFAARWSAMREFVALDPEAAHLHVAGMAADDPHPEVRRAAAATLALYAPEEAAPCPA